MGVGDPIELRFEGRWPDSSRAVRLAWRAPADTLLVVAIDSTAATEEEGWVAGGYRLTLVASRPGAIALPPGALTTATGETLAVSESHALRVTGRVPDEAQASLRPLAGVVSMRGFPWWAVVAGGLVAAGALATWVLARRRSAAPAQEAVVALPEPETEFHAALAALLDSGLMEEGRLREFVQELSWILRRYLGRRFQEPALEATRPEILRWLPRTRLAVADQQRIAGWLEETDGIKFAGRIPVLSAARELVERAREVVRAGEALAREEEARRARAASAAPADASEEVRP